MKIFALDTSTSMATVAISAGDRIVAESVFNSDRTLSARLIPEIERILGIAGVSLKDIDLFVASVGPGSFTGVRGGVATIQGLALAAGRPCAGFSSLALLAMNFPLSSHLICPLLDARKSEVYAALYDCSLPIPSALLNDCVMPPADFLDKLNACTDRSVIFAGEGSLRYRELIAERMQSRAVFAPFTKHAPYASNAVLLGLDVFRLGNATEPSRLLPVYLRASDAEINRNLNQTA